MKNYSMLSLLLVLLITSCGSSKIIPTTDVCSVVKHHEDRLYQVKINSKKISSRWYLKNDAIAITKMLAAKNKCMP